MDRRGGTRRTVVGCLLAACVTSVVATATASPEATRANADGSAAQGAAPPASTAHDPSRTPDSALAEAQQAYTAREWAEAARGARAVLTAEEAAGRPESARALRALDLLLGTLWRWRNVDAVETPALAERAVALRERLAGPDDPALALSLTNLGMVLEVIAEYDRALPPLERALAIRERALGPEHINVARSYQNLGRVYYGMGDYPAARSCHERALGIRERLLGAEDPELSVSLVDLAVVLRVQGDYITARPYFERALTIVEKAFGPEDANVGSAALDLGEVLRELGDYAGAEALFRRSLAIDLKALGPDHEFVGLNLSNLGYVLRDQGRLDEAEDAFERALEVRERALGPGHPDVLTTLKGLAGVLADRGDLAGARARLERALSLGDQSLGPDHPTIASCAAALGDVHRDEGNLARARELYERALWIREKALGDGHPLTAESRLDLARVLRATGDDTGALDAALRAQAALREHFQRTAGGLAEREALRYGAVRESGLDIALSVIASGFGGNAARRTWDEVVRSRALVLDEVASRHRLVSESDDAAVAAAAAGLARARARLSRLVVVGPDVDQPQGYALRLRAARDAEEAAERRLAEASRLFRRKEDRLVGGLEEVLRSLPAESALVSYVQYLPVAGPSDSPHGSAPAEPPAPGAGEPDATTYLALVARGGSAEIGIVRLGAVAEIDRRVQRWRGMITSPPTDPVDAAARRAAGNDLRAAVWDPVAARLGRARLTFVVPEGGLHLVGISALPAGGGHYVLETGPTVHYLAAERDLIPEGSAGVAPGGLLVVGGPDFDAAAQISPAGTTAATEGTSPAPGGPASPAGPAGAQATYRGQTPSCEVFRMLRFEPLPSAGAEAGEVAALWRRASRAPGQADVLELTSRHAAEATFKANAPGRSVLHLATHGFFLEDRCAPGTGGSAGRGAGAVAGAAATTDESPLLLTGLALAGANLRGAPSAGADREDGVLTAEEIASLDLRGLEWAVLSACGTGLGRVQTGEGVLGLRRAFQVAGARTVIMSLWSVEDHAAREWVRRLYESRLAGSTTADAVRQASLRILNDRRRAGVTTDPFYWGAFVAAGDWR